MNGFSIILAIFSILLTAIGQLLLKIGANLTDVNKWIPRSLNPYLNRFTIPGYSMLFIVTILSIYILKELPLKFFFPFFISGNLIAIVILSRLFLQEYFTKPKIIGIFLILSGIIIFTL
jgi:multidrug transporter EmrE-like cation transporter